VKQSEYQKAITIIRKKNKYLSY